MRDLEERLRQERRAFEGKLPSDPSWVQVESIAGQSEAIRQVKEVIWKVAATALPVLIRGETGTGKELVARAIHGESPRRQAPFIAVNCSSLPEPILETELFGYVQGAFSGADKDRSGLLVEANGGSFFFDEIGGMSLNLQGKLLRVLDCNSLRPVGGSEKIRIDVR